MGQSIYQLHQHAHTPWEWYAPDMEQARERGIAFSLVPAEVAALVSETERAWQALGGIQ